MYKLLILIISSSSSASCLSVYAVNPTPHPEENLPYPILEKVDCLKVLALFHKVLGRNSIEQVVDIPSREVFDQFYFQGIVYRLDTRGFREIVDSRGFDSRQPRPNEKNLLAHTCSKGENISTLGKNIVATSKHIDSEFIHSGYKKKYMIDTDIVNISGLDLEKTLSTLCTNYHHFIPTTEVCHEEIIPVKAIIGYVNTKGFTPDHLKDNKTVDFYKNPDYKGTFRWNDPNTGKTSYSMTNGQSYTY